MLPGASASDSARAPRAFFMPNRLAAREQPVSPAARRTIPSTGTRGGTRRSRARATEDLPDLPLDRLLDLPLVPRDGARVVRERRRWPRVLNAGFVPVKVDREERPDVDRVYMAFVQATTGSGGWPMSVWLTPDLKPFYGGTYFPPTSRWGRPGFVEVLTELSRAVARRAPAGARRRRRADRAAARARPRARRTAADGDDGTDDAATRRRASRRSRRTSPRFASAFDRALRRLRRRAEVPASLRAGVPAARVRAHRRRTRRGRWRSRRCGRWRSAACATISAAASIAIRWTRAGACRTSRRCSTTRRSWCWPVSRRRRRRATASMRRWPRTRSTTSRRELTHEPAASIRPRTPTAWRPSSAGDPPRTPRKAPSTSGRRREIDALFTEAEARVVRLRFGIEPNGNAPSDPQGEFGAQEPALHGCHDRGDRRAHRPDARSTIVDDARRARGQTLFRGARAAAAAASRRQGPGVVERADDCRLGARRPDHRRPRARGWRRVRARGRQRAARFIRAELWNAATAARCCRRWRDGTGRDRRATARTTPAWCGARSSCSRRPAPPSGCRWALELQARQDALFWDEADGGWFNTTGHDASVLLRLKEDYDGAEPAASSIGVRNLLELSHLVADGGFAERAERTLARFGPRMARPRAPFRAC